MKWIKTKNLSFRLFLEPIFKIGGYSYECKLHKQYLGGMTLAWLIGVALGSIFKM